MKFHFHPGRSWLCFMVTFKIYSTNLEVGPRSISVITTWHAAATAGQVCFHSICSQNPICAGLEMMDHMYRRRRKQRRLIKTYFTRHRVASDAKWEKRVTAQPALAEKLLHKNRWRSVTARCRHPAVRSRLPPNVHAVRHSQMERSHRVLTQGSAEQRAANGADAPD